MPRLRTTGVLSVLALALGIAGTAWLSDLTDVGYRPPPLRVAAQRSTPVHRQHRQHRRAPAVATVRRGTVTPSPAAEPTPARADINPELVAQVTTMDASQPWEHLRGHLDGRVLLDVGVDGTGRVVSASVARSSGDERLDAYAARSVRLWRFAVPAGHPDGLHGQVPMRFTSAGAPR